MRDRLMTLLLKEAGSLSLLGLVVSATVISSLYLNRVRSENDIIESPLVQIRKLPQNEQDHLPYPPDVLPGGRDVESPYGRTRVYEWGPELGRKVLLIHGISTPGIALGALAEQLVDNGCRVMLFGR